MKGLTERQRSILDFIQSYIHEKRFSPSFREIQEHFGFKSLGSVHRHIHALEKKGLIQMNKQQSRSLYVVEQKLQAQEQNLVLPIIGHLIAGEPLEIFAQSSNYSVPLSMVPNPTHCYLLRAVGNGLLKEHIVEGDLVLIEVGAPPEDGDAIIGMTDTQETLVKRYYREEEYIRLTGLYHSEDSTFFHHDNFAVQGIIRNVLRSLTHF